MLSKCKDSNVFPPTLGADAKFVPLVTNWRDFRSRKRTSAWFAGASLMLQR